ncbi:DUF732 domain-containing protein [Mycolicibacterium thermoresistibile]
MSFAVALAAAAPAGAEPDIGTDPAVAAEAAAEAEAPDGVESAVQGTTLAGDGPGDDAYVEAMTSHGIYRERGALIATGIIICEDLQQVAQTGPNLVPTPLLVMSALHVMPWEADFAINEAKRIYCPQYN